MEPCDVMLAWIDQDIAALQSLTAPDEPLAPPRTAWGSRGAPVGALLVRSAALLTTLRELTDEARALRQEAEALRRCAAAQERSWSVIWGIAP